MQVMTLLNKNESPTCAKCIHSNENIFGCFDNTGVPIEKKETDSCSHGQWMVRYRYYVHKMGKLTPKKNTQIYIRTKDGILVDRMRFAMLNESSDERRVNNASN